MGGLSINSTKTFNYSASIVEIPVTKDIERNGTHIMENTTERLFRVSMIKPI